MEEFQALHEDFFLKKHRTWSQDLEDQTLKLLDLGSKFSLTKQVREILVAFKSICQNTAPQSIGPVFRHAIGNALSFLPENSLVCEDLDAPYPPEWFQSCSRSLIVDRFRFAWEVLKVELEVLRNNRRFEEVFLAVAREAFSFCRRFQRRFEIRRLGEFLRNCLHSLLKTTAILQQGGYKAAQMQFAVSLGSQESALVQTQVRLEHFAAVIALGQWSEAYRVIEDLQVLFTSTRRSLDTLQLVGYFSGVAQVFTCSRLPGYQLYGCGALLRSLGAIPREGEVRETVDMLLLSLLSVPKHYAANLEDERMAKLASFLGLATSIQRSAVEREIFYSKVAALIRQQATPAIFSLFAAATNGNASQVSLALSAASSQIPERTVDAIRFAINKRLLESFLERLAVATDRKISIADAMNFFVLDPNASRLSWERFLVTQCWKLRSIALLICHQSETVRLLGDFSLSALVRASAPVALPRRLPSGLLSDPRIALERSDRCQRCKKIDERKERREHENTQREIDVQKQRAALELREQEAEKQRQAEEAKKREADRIAREKAAIEKDETVRSAEEFLKKSAAAGKRFTMNSQSFTSKMDFIKEQLRLLEQDRSATECHVRDVTKKSGYLQRAIRLQELPILDQLSESHAVQRREFYDVRSAQKRQQLKSTHDRLTTLLQHSGTMQSDFRSFKEETMNHRRSAFEKAVAEEQERQAREKAEAERVVQEKAEADRLAEEEQRAIQQDLGPVPKVKFDVVQRSEREEFSQLFFRSSKSTGEMVRFQRSEMMQTSVDTQSEAPPRQTVEGSIPRALPQGTNQKPPSSFPLLDRSQMKSIDANERPSVSAAPPPAKPAIPKVMNLLKTKAEAKEHKPE